MFSDILKKLRTDKNLTQEQLAKLINVERSSVGKYESTNVIPSPEVLKRIAQVFNCSTDFLLENEEIAPPVYDPEALAFLDEIRNRSELKLLFSVSKNATKADIEAAIKIIEAFKERENRDGT